MDEEFIKIMEERGLIMKEGSIEKKDPTELRPSLREFILQKYQAGKGFEGSGLQALNPLEIYIADLVGERENLLARKLPKKFRDAAALFLEELIDFIREKSTEKGETEKIQRFVSQISEDLFSFTPNLINHTGMENMLRLATKATRIPEIQGWFGNEMVGEVSYELAFSGEEVVGFILEKWQNKPISEVLDFLNFMESVGANAIANGSWARQTVKKVHQIIQGINLLYPCAFVEYASKEAEQTLKEEKNNPSVGVAQYRGDRGNSRLRKGMNRDLKKESSELMDQITPDVQVTSENKMWRVSSDMVAIFDHSNTARFYGVYEKKEQETAPVKEEREHVLRANINKLHSFLHKNNTDALINSTTIRDLVDFITGGCLKQKINLSDQDNQAVAGAWEEVSSVLTKEEWERVVEGLNLSKIAEKKALEYRSQEFKRAEDDNEAASEELLQKFYIVGKKLIADKNPNFSVENWREFLSYYNPNNKSENDTENAFGILASSLSFAASVLSDKFGAEEKKRVVAKMSSDHKGLVEDYLFLRNKHLENWNIAQRKVREFEENLEVELQKKKSETESLLKKIVKKGKKFITEITKEVDGWQAKAREQNKEVHFSSLDSVLQDEKVNPFGKDSPDLSLLMQHLHNPRFSQMIEQDLGISLSNLPLRYQVHLLGFLAEKDNDNFLRLQNILKEKNSLGNILVPAFLSCAESKSYGEQILTLVESGNENEVAKILADHLKIVEYADNFYQVIAPRIKRVAPSFDEKGFYLSLLSRANSLIGFSAQYFKNNKAGSYTDILKDIESEDRGLSPESCMEAVVSKAIIEMVNAVGDVEARAVLDDVYQENQSAEIRKAIELAYSFITPVVTDAKAIRDLGDFYNKEIKFEEYKVNQAMNEAELAMMKGVVKKGDRVLDLGCGTGRLFVPLAESGVSAVGLDYSSRHVSLVREQNPSLVVTQGDWKNTGLQAKDFNVIYSLGRNILHEHQLPGQQKLFAETNRLLPIGGKFIFDIPDRSIGGYKKLCAEYARVMKQRGITKFREGTIYDSPDGKNFATRYAYSHEDVVQLAEDNGFEIERVEKKELATGQDDVNIYYTLKKVRESGEAKMSYSLAA